MPPVSENQLIITEISPNDDLVEVTYFDSRTAKLTRDFWFTVDGLPLHLFQREQYLKRVRVKHSLCN